MKLIIYILLLYSTIGISKSQGFQIRIYNKTGFDIHLLRLNDVYMGDIKKDSSLLLRNWKEIRLEGKVPWGRLKGYIKGQQEDKMSHFICGTAVRTVNSGNYEFDLFVHFFSYGYDLYFSPH